MPGDLARGFFVSHGNTSTSRRDADVGDDDGAAMTFRRQHSRFSPSSPQYPRLVDPEQGTIPRVDGATYWT
ncbi:MAG: hypothetical protein OXI72_22270 [Gemmatimonadota bacterium]|nr:hypothetical protein [Gemmatimonadota bacterium]